MPLQSALLAKDDEPGDDFSFQSTTRDIIAQAWRKKAGEVSSKLGGFLGDHEVTSAQKNASKSEIGHRVTALPSGRPSSILQLAAEAISALESEGQYADTFYVTDLGAASALYRHIARAMPRVSSKKQNIQRTRKYCSSSRKEAFFFLNLEQFPIFENFSK